MTVRDFILDKFCALSNILKSSKAYRAGISVLQRNQTFLKAHGADIFPVVNIRPVESTCNTAQYNVFVQRKKKTTLK